MPWSNPGPARQVLIVGSTGDLLVYDGNAFFGNPFGTLIAAISGADGEDPTNNFNFYKGISLFHGQNTSINFGINGPVGVPDQYGALESIIDGLLHAHLKLIGPGNGPPKALIDIDSNGGAQFHNDTGGGVSDTGIGFNYEFGGVGITTKSGTSITLGNTGATIILGPNGTPFGQLETGTATLTFSGSATSAATAVTFSSPMPSAAYMLAFGMTAITGNTVVSASWFNKTANGFSVIGRVDNGNVFTGSQAVDWIAIGA